jgi:hypothetical protein
MKTKSITVALILTLAGAAHGAVETKNIDKKAHDIIAKKCTGCHGEAQITAAFKSGRDMQTIQKDMQKRGAKLSANEQEVLGIFWKKSQPVK